MTHSTLTLSEFVARAGKHLEEAGRDPVFITDDGGRDRVMIDVAEYERLKAYDTRRAFYPEELPDHILAAMERGYQGCDASGP